MLQLQGHHEDVLKRCQWHMCFPQVSEGERFHEEPFSSQVVTYALAFL